jgi:DNA-binding NarL/FixJ family response regulator
MIRVVIVDDQPLILVGLRMLLEVEEDISLVGAADDGHTAVDLVRRTRPDVVLMDIRMPGTGGIEALRAIAEQPGLDTTRVVMLTTFDLDEYIFEAIQAGASGFLIKDAEPEELVRAVRVVAGGESLLAPSVTRRLIAAFVARSGRRPHPGVPALTAREREVVGLVGAGMSNEDIAAQLFLSPATVRTHVERAMAKLDVHDRARLVVVAYQSGLVASDPAGG